MVHLKYILFNQQIRWLAHRYEEDADAPGTWYNAYSPGEATVKATLEGPGYRSILTIESVR